MIIRKAKLSDTMNIAKMHYASFRESVRPLVEKEALTNIHLPRFIRRWHLRLGDKNKHTYVACLNNKIIGLICFHLTAKHAQAEISLVYIHPDYWRGGVGRRLMQVTMNYLKNFGITQIKIWVLKQNPKSRGFYEALGGKPTNIDREVTLCNIKLTEIMYYLSIATCNRNKLKNDRIFSWQYKKVV